MQQHRPGPSVNGQCSCTQPQRATELAAAQHSLLPASVGSHQQLPAAGGQGSRFGTSWPLVSARPEKPVMGSTSTAIEMLARMVKITSPGFSFSPCAETPSRRAHRGMKSRLQASTARQAQLGLETVVSWFFTAETYPGRFACVLHMRVQGRAGREQVCVDDSIWQGVIWQGAICSADDGGQQGCAACGI